MPLVQLFVLVILTLAQVDSVPSFSDDVLNPKEREKLAIASNAEARIKVYESATKRIQQTLRTMAAGGDFAKIPDTVKEWNSLLAGSLADIEANLKTKKKSRALIKYEIRVRKILTDAQDYKNRLPLDQIDAFSSYLDDAEKVRKRFVEIIFKQ